MFARVKTVIRGGKALRYLQIVENIWDKKRKRATQRAVFSMGRIDTLDRSKVDKLVATLSRFTEKVKVLRTSEDMLLRWAKEPWASENPTE